MTLTARHTAGGGWSQATPLPGIVAPAGLSFDGFGNGALSGLTGTGLAAVAGFDGEPPQVLEAGATPETAFPGDAVTFDASVIDVWSPFTVQWGFGDGATASGTPATHAFGAPGTFSVSLTATDAVGNDASGAAPYTVSARPAPPAATVTPVPPSAPSAAGPAQPRAKATTLRALRRRGLAFSQRFASPGAAAWTLELQGKRGRSGTVLGRVTRRIATASTAQVRLRLSRQGSRLAALRRPKRLVLRTVFTPAAGGPPSTITVTVTVRR